MTKWYAIAAVALLAGCNVPGPSLAGYEGLQFKVRQYYANHAVEENAVCRAPEMRGITQTRILEDSDDNVVVRVRYYYRDNAFRIEDSPAIIGNCDGFNSRDFTIAKSDNSLKVVDMTGPRKLHRRNFSGNG